VRVITGDGSTTVGTYYLVYSSSSSTLFYCDSVWIISEPLRYFYLSGSKVGNCPPPLLPFATVYHGSQDLEIEVSTSRGPQYPSYSDRDLEINENFLRDPQYPFYS
jgi:hypothetical protein